MIIPNKHVRIDESILGLGAVLLTELSHSMSFDELWYAFSRHAQKRGIGASFDVGLFLLTIDWLFTIGAVELDHNYNISRCG